MKLYGEEIKDVPHDSAKSSLLEQTTKAEVKKCDNSAEKNTKAYE